MAAFKQSATFRKRGKSEMRGGGKLERSVIKETFAPESGFVAPTRRLARLLGSDWFLLL